MAVIGEVGGAKHHEAVEHRQDPRLATRHVPVPQLEVATVLIAPIFVQIYEEIEATIQLQFGMDIEVSVYLQEAARLNLVKTTTAEIRIRNQTFDSG